MKSDIGLDFCYCVSFSFGLWFQLWLGFVLIPSVSASDSALVLVSALSLDFIFMQALHLVLVSDTYLYELCLLNGFFFEFFYVWLLQYCTVLYSHFSLTSPLASSLALASNSAAALLVASSLTSSPFFSLFFTFYITNSFFIFDYYAVCCIVTMYLLLPTLLQLQLLNCLLLQFLLM